MCNIMPSKPLTLFPVEEKLLIEFGERLKLARLRRQLSMETVAARARISRATLGRAEEGSSAVTFGAYVRILSILGLEGDIKQLAADDVLGRKLQDLGLPTRQRARKT